MIDIKGQFAYWLIRDGKVIDHQRKKNLVVDSARMIVSGLVANDANFHSGIKAIAIGTGNTSPSHEQSTLVSEVFRRNLPAFGTDTSGSANYLTVSGGRYKATFRETLSPLDPTGDYGGTLKDGVNTSSSIEIKEAGLFGNLIAMATPSISPTLTAASSGGSLEDTSYDVKFTWANLTGETALTSGSAASHTFASGSTNKLTVTIPSTLSTATTLKIYMSINGTDYYLQKSVAITDWSGTQVVQITDPFSTATLAPTTNSSTLPGIIDGGTMFNRILIGPVVMTAADRVIVESILEF